MTAKPSWQPPLLPCFPVSSPGCFSAVVGPWQSLARTGMEPGRGQRALPGLVTGTADMSHGGLAALETRDFRVLGSGVVPGTPFGNRCPVLSSARRRLPPPPLPETPPGLCRGIPQRLEGRDRSQRTLSRWGQRWES